VQLEAGMGTSQRRIAGVFVGGGVVGDHVNVQPGGDLGVDAGKEALELHRPMTSRHLRDGYPRGQVQHRIQVGGAMAVES
jgi:hypothetical protein